MELNRKPRRCRRPGILLLISILCLPTLWACSRPAGSPAAETYWPTAGWRVATPEEQGVDSDLLADMLELVLDRGYNIDSVLIVRNGYLVLEAYAAPYDADSRHIVHSCTKSIISALVGIAIEQGYLEGVDQPVLEIFSERTVAHRDAAKEAMTLEHVLMMATGLECRDSYLYNWRGLQEMRASGDWVQFVLDLPMSEEPGTKFEYCNGAAFLLSAILQEKTGQSAAGYARKHLFGPLGISDVEWPANLQGITIGWGKLRMRPRDMAKIGYLYLNGGRWEGEQVVPSAWVEVSTRQHIVAGTLQDGYGYQWWIDSSGPYMALGYAGQYIAVVPEKDMVVVFTSELPDSEFFVPRDLLEQFIIPAARSTDPLPGNPGGVDRLQDLEAMGVP
jgi:CubicO group peptidase (beta-lactamase class C family)